MKMKTGITSRKFYSSAMQCHVNFNLYLCRSATTACRRERAVVLNPVNRLSHPVVNVLPPTSIALLSPSYFHTWVTNLNKWTDSQISIPAQKIPTEPAEPSPSLNPASRRPRIIDTVAQGIVSVSPNTGETYQAYSKGRDLYLECARQADYVVRDSGKGKEMEQTEEAGEGDISGLSKAKFWYETCNREKSFNSWANVTILHIWTLLVKFRAFPNKDKTQIWQRHLVDHFFFDAEEKMEKQYSIKSGPSRSRYLKDLFVQYRGQVAAYDEGFAKGDAVLAAALWRNIFDAKPDVNFETLALVTSYVRRILSGLDKVSDEKVCAAMLKFGDPRNELALVREESRGFAEWTKSKENIAG